jgi:hypothetical protein
MNWKALLSIGVVMLLAYLFIPNIAGYSWVLLVLLCPLGMMFMMAGMEHGNNVPEKVFACTECGMSYKEAEWAKKCTLWCKEHQSCNLEIIEHAIK